MPDLPVRSGFLINNCQKLSSLSYDSNTLILVEGQRSASRWLEIRVIGAICV